MSGFNVLFIVLLLVFNGGIFSQIDLSELLQSSEVMTCDPTKATRVWRDAYFTLKYYSDAMFDFSHWFGFSNRAFNVKIGRAHV